MRTSRVMRRMVVFARTLFWLGNNLENSRFPFLMCCYRGFGEFSTDLTDEKAKKIATRAKL